MIIAERETLETRVRLRVGAGTGADGRPGIATGDAFLDHMLNTLARHASLALEVDAAGDLRHHLIEDVAITLGAALARLTPAACARYGEARIAMDDALVEVTLDAGGRFYYRGRLRATLYEHFLRSLAEHARFTLHVRVLRGTDRHHIIEAAMKALGVALRQALVTQGTVFSTKGAVRMRVEEEEA